jgi:isopenicillin-N epimerase
LREQFLLEPDLVFLNHGSYGACPRAVLEAQSQLRERIEHDPVRFFSSELEPLLDSARDQLAAFVGADVDELVFVSNATSGVNAILRSLELKPGDELLSTNHAYNACMNALAFAGARAGARVVVAEVPFPIGGENEVVDAVLSRVSSRTRLALVDHVTSPTALVWPVEKLVRELAARGVDTLVDGAHAPGMLPLELRSLGAAYYTGNCHKWLCAPKGAGFLCVRRDRQDGVMPLAVSHGYNAVRPERSRLRLLFDWVGTDDPTAWLCVPEAIRWLGALEPGGLPALMARNRARVLEARRHLADRLAIALPAPDGMIGSMAALPLRASRKARSAAELQEALYTKHRIQVPVVPWPTEAGRLLRISSQCYNTPEEYEHLGRALADLI